MNSLRKKILDTQDKCIKLRLLAMDNKLPKQKTLEIRKERNVLEKKANFFKELDSAIRKG